MSTHFHEKSVATYKFSESLTKGNFNNCLLVDFFKMAPYGCWKNKSDGLFMHNFVLSGTTHTLQA
jgi:hypothetical protein